MVKDKRGVPRGACIVCECHNLCDYRGHPPVMHLALVPIPKRARLDNITVEQEAEISKNAGDGNTLAESNGSSESHDHRDDEAVARNVEGGEIPEPTPEFAEPGPSGGTVSDYVIIMLHRQADEFNSNNRGREIRYQQIWQNDYRDLQRLYQNYRCKRNQRTP